MVPQNIQPKWEELVITISNTIVKLIKKWLSGGYDALKGR